MAGEPRERPALEAALTLPHRALVLSALSGLAFAQPLLGNLTEGFLVAHRVQPFDALVVAALLILAPPAVLLALEELVRRVARGLLIPLHVALVAGLTSLAVSQALLQPDGDWGPRMLAGVVAGVLLAVAYVRWGPVRSFAAALVVAPVLTLFNFVSVGPAAEIVFPKEVSVKPPPVQPRPEAPVVIVIFDELPATTLTDERGRIDARLFPNFARMARHAHWFPNATTVHNGTRRAVPAILTGRVSPQDAQPRAADHPRSVFTLLGSRYHEKAFEPFTQMCPPELCEDDAAESASERVVGLIDNVGRLSARRYLPRRYRDRVPAIEQWRYQNSADEVRRFAKDIGREDGRPALRVLHLVLPHKAWRFLPTGETYNTDVDPNAGQRGDRRSDDEWPVAQRFQRHVLQTQYTDRLLGQVIDRLKETGQWDRSLVVAVADHGETLRPGDAARERPDRENLDEVMSVPLLIKPPGERTGRVSQRLVQTIDVVPTIADVLRVDVPWKLDGRSVFTSGPDRRTVTLRFVVRGEKKRLTISRSTLLARNRDLSGPRGVLREARRAGGDAFAMGPYPSLVGRDLPERRPAGRGSASLTGGAQLKPRKPGARELPARLSGTVSGIAPGRPLAVAVDGVVVATTETYTPEFGGGTLFTAMVPAKTFRRGGRISLTTISGPARSPRLARIRVSG